MHSTILSVCVCVCVFSVGLLLFPWKKAKGVWGRGEAKKELGFQFPSKVFKGFSLLEAKDCRSCNNNHSHGNNNNSNGNDVISLNTVNNNLQSLSIY